MCLEVCITLPETNSLPLNLVVPHRSIFRSYVSFREGTHTNVLTLRRTRYIYMFVIGWTYVAPIESAC